MATKKSGKAPSEKGATASVPRAFVVTIFTVVGLCILLFAGVFALDASHKDTIFPGVTAGGISLSGLTKEAAQAVLDERSSEIENAGITLVYQGEKSIIDSTTSAADEVDSALPLYTYDTHEAVSAAFSVGRSSKNGLSNIIAQVGALLFKKQVTSGLQFDTSACEAAMRSAVGAKETPAKNAHLKMTAEGDTRATNEESGQAFDFASYVGGIQQMLATYRSPEVTLALTIDTPKITAAHVADFFDEAQAVYRRAPFTVTWEDKSWQLEKAAVAAALDVELVNKKQQLVFSAQGLEAFFGTIKNDVDIKAQDAKFSISNGKVSEFQASRDGRTVDTDATRTAMQKNISDPKITSVALVVKSQLADVRQDNAASFGITELVAEASTNFKGSPKNRRLNIANGAKLLYGTLIKPGEEFSLVTKLKPIDTSNGYLPELVIKGDRTIPEVGGGLCQIGTTMFRVVLNAGLPVLERKNHSYRVSYYEPPVGMDATIYDSKPDFRFVNDYASHLLLLTFVDGDDITFQLWGTKDNRKVAMTTPKIYNVTKPGPTKYIETTDLKPGEKKCIEHAHNGGSADFTYTVTYSSGEEKVEKFSSKYKAWQEVCLVGKES